MFSNLLQDIRFGLRLLAKSPAIAINAVITLALAVGANSAVFSVVNSVLLRPLPFANPDRLVMLWQTNPNRGQQLERVAWRDVLTAWRPQSSAFENIGSFAMFNENFLGDSAAQRLIGCRMTSNLFPLLGVAPRLGRSFVPEDELLPAGRRVVILSDAFWRRAFGADPNIVGKPIRFVSNTFTIIGVMPPEFHFPSKAITPGWGFLSREAEVFEPLVLVPFNVLAQAHTHLVIARLKNQVTIEQAGAEMKVIARRLEEQHPETNAGWGVAVTPMTDQVVGEARPAIAAFAGAVTFVLLIACANVAGLLLVRNSTRQKELAIRRAMGASESRIMWQLLTESVILAIAGGSLGLLLAYAGVHFLVLAAPDALPRLEEIRMDGSALAYTALVSIATGVLCGLMPALQSRRAAPFDVLKAEGRSAAFSRGRIRAQQLLVAAEIAMSLFLLAGAGLLLRSYQRLETVDPGFRPEQVLSLQMTASPTTYPQPAQIAAVFRQVNERLGRLPGVKSAGGISSPPLTALATAFPIAIEGRPETMVKPRTEVGLYGVTPGYFTAMGIRVERGRLIAADDKRGGNLVAVISHSIAERFWPRQDPIGKLVRVEAGADNPWMTIIGVVGDVRFQGLDTAPTLAVYHPHEQQTWRSMAFAVRTEGPPAALIPAVRNEIAAIDREMPVFNLIPVETMLENSTAKPRFQTLLILSFAGIALALALIGVYGVMSYSVGQRTQEIGIRMALGAKPGDVARMILREGFVIVVVGCGIGLAVALASGRLIARFLFQTAPNDFVTLAGISLLLTGATLLATYLPARRATRIDPMAALREN